MGTAQSDSNLDLNLYWPHFFHARPRTAARNAQPTLVATDCPSCRLADRHVPCDGLDGEEPFEAQGGYSAGAACLSDEHAHRRDRLRDVVLGAGRLVMAVTWEERLARRFVVVC